MAELVKFHEKNIAIFSKVESVSNTYQTGIVAADAVAALAITGNVTYETASYQYLVSELDRSETSYLKDSFAELSVETPIQVLGSLDTGLSVANVPLSNLLRCCGGAISVSGSTGIVTIDNKTAENTTISANYTHTSIQDTINYKLFKFYGIRGGVDITFNTTEVPKYKFNLKGNAFPSVASTKVIPDFGNQTIHAAAPVRLATIQSSLITPYGENFNAQSTISGTPSIAFNGVTATVTLSAHGLTDKRLVNISGATGADAAYYNGDFQINYVDANTFTYVMNGTPSGVPTGTLVAKKDGYAKAFCFDKLTANNFFGFDYARYLTACEEGFSKTAVPTDVAITLLEPQSPSFDIVSITKSGTTATVTVATTNASLTTGNSVTISGATGADATLYNITALITKTGDNTFTYVMGGTPSGSATGNLRYINNSVTFFDPDTHFSEFFGVQIKIGTGVGKYVTLEWNKLQVANIKEGKVGSYYGRDVTLRNTGNSTIILS